LESANVTGIFDLDFLKNDARRGNRHREEGTPVWQKPGIPGIIDEPLCRNPYECSLHPISANP
jgi:hypothetical protein